MFHLRPMCPCFVSLPFHFHVLFYVVAAFSTVRVRLPCNIIWNLTLSFPSFPFLALPLLFFLCFLSFPFSSHPFPIFPFPFLSFAFLKLLSFLLPSVIFPFTNTPTSHLISPYTWYLLTLNQPTSKKQSTQSQQFFFVPTFYLIPPSFLFHTFAISV